MTSGEARQVRRGVAMVGPPYLYNGAQVCGRRTGRTCIFLLASFGIALTMIGLVFLTADLKMESGLWVAGVVVIILGAVLLMWFMTLCCAARCAFNKLPATHPARIMPATPVLVPPRSSTYQLLPMTPTRTHVTPATNRSATQTLPSSVTKKTEATGPSLYPTWGYVGRTPGYASGPQRTPPSVYATATAPSFPEGYGGLRGYSHENTMMEYGRSSPLVVHSPGRASPALHHSGYATGYSMTLQHPNASPPGYKTDDNPPPYHAVVSRP